MVIAITLPVIFGYRVFIETINNPVTDKLLDWEVDVADTDIWIADKLHIVISNERHYKTTRINEE